jgi:hypothetical protein
MVPSQYPNNENSVTTLLFRELRGQSIDCASNGSGWNKALGVEDARKSFCRTALAVDTLVELTKDNHADSTRFAAATALLDRSRSKDNHADSTRFAAATPLLDRGYGRPAQSLDLRLSADAITKRLSDMSDAELAALGQRMIAAAPIVLEATAEVSDDAGELADGDVEGSPPDAPA